MAILWNETTFRKWYSMFNGQGGMTTYSRIGYRYWSGNWWGQTTEFPDHPMNEMRLRVENLTANWPIAQSDRILVVGAGFGFLVEALRWAGYTKTWGTDTSTFVNQNMPTEAHPSLLTPTNQILNRDIHNTSNQTKNAFSSVTGGTSFDWIITESVIESHTPAEYASFLNACETWLTSGRPHSQILHIVFSGWDATADGGSPPRTIDQWQAIRPAHSWAEPYGRWWSGVRVGS